METQRMSGVINIEEVKNPVQVAQILMRRSRFRWKWCDKFRTENGFESFSTEIPQRRTEYEEKLKSSGTGTVGCVALIKTENSGSHIYRR
jgi:L-asparaginase